MDPEASAALPDASRARFQDAVLAFQSQCFWWWDISRPITTRTAAREVIRQLRLHGGKSGWRAAAELVRCL